MSATWTCGYCGKAVLGSDCECGMPDEREKTITELEQKIKDDDWRWKEYFGASKEDYHKKVKECEELRTRVAELEQCLSGRARFQENEKLNKRVAELEKENKTFLEQSLYGINHGVELQKANEELQNRLSTLEKQVINARQDVQSRNEQMERLQIVIDGKDKTLARLEKELSTVGAELLLLSQRYADMLKASEGMEKALEYCATPYMQRITPFADIEARIFTATKALADFRAVKDTMEKGEGK